MVPGILSSILEGSVNIPADAEVPLDDKCQRQKDYSRMWFALKDINPFVNECSLGYLNCMYDRANKMSHDMTGVSVQVPKFGSTYAVDTVDPSWPICYATKAFADLIKKFKKLGYTDGEDMLGVGYDWRYFSFDKNKYKDNWFENVKNLIMKTKDKYNQKVVMITHSMGGLMTYKFLDYVGQEFVDKYIERWVMMSAPFLGASKVIAASFPGDNLGLPISGQKVRKFVRTIETGAFLFPTGGNSRWGSNNILEVKSTGKGYTVDDMLELIKTVDDADFQSIATDVYTHGINELYKKYNYKIPAKLETHCLITSGVDTIQGVQMETEDYDGKFKLIYGDGDGTVPIQSLEFCSQMGVNDVKNLGKYDHTGILDDKVSYEALVPYICN